MRMEKRVSRKEIDACMSIMDYLLKVTGQTGKPAHDGKGHAQRLYRSPLRADDDNASFAVTQYEDKQRWYDFGTGRKGGACDLLLALGDTDTLNRLESGDGCDLVRRDNPSSVRAATNVASAPAAPATTYDIVVKEITHRALIDYARSRCVSPLVLARYCKEIWSGRLFWVGLPNVAGGWALRNGSNMQTAKCNRGPQSYSYFAPLDANGKPVPNSKLKTLLMFEGMFDFLAFASAYEAGGRSLVADGRAVVVLNSVHNLYNARCSVSLFDLVGRFASVCTYFDTDDAGRQATATVVGWCGNKAVDKSVIYAGYNDVNEYICKGKRAS